MNESDLLNIDEFNELFIHSMKKSESIENVVLQKDKPIERPIKLYGINSGLRDLDKLTNGWKDGEVIYFGVSPKVNKSDFARTLLLSPVINEVKSIGYFSNNADVNNLIGTLCSTYMGLFGSTFKEGADTLSNAPIHLECRNKISITELKYKVYLLKNIDSIDMVIIEDFESIFHTDKSLSKSQIECFILKSLKEIALFFNLPIIVLSQLRLLQYTQSLLDIKGMEYVENHADIIFLLRESGRRPKEINLMDIDYGRIENNDYHSDSICVKFEKGFNYFTNYY